MKRWSFAFTRRWYGYTSLVVAFAILCCFLGAWQFARRAEAQVEIGRIDANYDAEPVPLQSLLPNLDSFEPDQKWSNAVLRGQYLRDEQLLVRNRPHSGAPGYEVLTPLRLDNGNVFLVDRGWLPFGSTKGIPDEIPAAPPGEVTVTVRLLAGEPTIPGRTDSADGNQIATINLESVAERLDHPLYTGAYGLLVSESPAAANRPYAAIKPVRDEGPHLSYALQWYVFAILGFIGLGWALRQEYRVVNSEHPEEIERARERARKKALKTRSDSEEEDAILDARERR